MSRSHPAEEEIEELRAIVEEQQRIIDAIKQQLSGCDNSLIDGQIPSPQRLFNFREQVCRLIYPDEPGRLLDPPDE